MDDSFAPDGAIDQAALKALSKPSDVSGLTQLAGHGAVLAATGWLVAQATGTLWLVPAWVAHGIVLVFLFAPLHETIHRTAFRTRWLNDAVAWVCGAMLLLPPKDFRAFHFAHHRHTQDPARDPELAVPKPDSRGRYLLHVAGLPYWWGRAAALLRHAAGRVEEPFVPARQRPAVVREARLLLLVYVGIAAGSALLDRPAALAYWIVPALLGQPFLRLYLLAEHAGCPHVAEMLRNSRTIETLWPVRRLAWNMPYHTAHHTWPALPFHALPAAHEHLKGRIAAPAPGYLAVHRKIIAGLGRPAPEALHPRAGNRLRAGCGQRRGPRPGLCARAGIDVARDLAARLDGEARVADRSRNPSADRDRQLPADRQGTVDDPSNRGRVDLRRPREQAALAHLQRLRVERSLDPALDDQSAARIDLALDLDPLADDQRAAGRRLAPGDRRAAVARR